MKMNCSPMFGKGVRERVRYRIELKVRGSVRPLMDPAMLLYSEIQILIY